MSESFYGRISIGGELPKDKLPEFLEKIEEDTGSNYGTLDRIPDNNGTLYIEDSEARNGEFNYLEDWCRDNNLSYIRESSACGEYSAEIVWWIPGMEKLQVVYCTEDQEPYLLKKDLEEILSFLDKVKDLKDASLLIDDNKEWAMEVINEGNIDPVAFMRKRINETCPDSPALPKFTLK